MARVNDMTDTERASRTAAAVDAAMGAARELGLDVSGTTVLHDLFFRVGGAAAGDVHAVFTV